MWSSVDENSSQVQTENMNNEWARVGSFSCYTFTLDVSSIKLASEGFFLSDNDVIKCYSCGITVTHWDKKEDPAEFHRRRSPSCSHVTGNNSSNVAINREMGNPLGIPANNEQHHNHHIFTDGESNNFPRNASSFNSESQGNTGNRDNRETTDIPQQRNSTHNTSLPGNGNQTMENHRSFTNTTVTGSASNDSDSPNSTPSFAVETHGVSFSKPKYPAYAILSVRESTYTDWPSYLKQTKEEMSGAGFVYTGHADYTRCFYCGGGLKNWEPGDDPWVEHARWFPGCVFVRQNKGVEFVNSILDSYSASSEKCSNEQIPQDKPKPPAETEEGICVYPAVQSVLEMGYSKSLVEKAVFSLGNTKSLRYIAAEDLLEEVFRLQENNDSGFISGESSVQETSHHETKDLTSSSNPEESQEITKLMLENEELKNMSTCKVCKENEVSIVFLPCGHLVCCPDCGPAMAKCPACKVKIHASVKAWLV